MKRSLPLLLVFLCIVFQSYAQQAPTPIFIAEDAPDWMHLMQAPNPNVAEVKAAYERWYANRPFEKNSYTQYYKRWMQWARPLVQADGTLHQPDAAEMQAWDQTVRATRQIQAPGASSNGSWSFVGPKQTYHTDGTTIVTWQTNIYSFDIAPSDANVLYAGGESGGLWRTADKGLNWTLLSANITHGAFGAVKIHPADPNTFYAATGGKIIKSTDGGATLTTVYTENNLWVNEFAISTADPNIILAAADQGLLRSTNGGTTWTKLFTNQTWTVKQKPGDANTFWAVRKNGSASDFMRSTNAGASFVTANSGWWAPGSGESVTGAIIAVCPSSPSKLYAYLCGSGSNLKGYIGVFVSNNNGDTWANTNPQNSIGNSPVAYVIPGHTNLMTNNGLFTGFDQGFYDMAIVVNPNNANQLIAGGTSWFRSNDGGATWSALGGYVGTLSWSHPDIQCLAAQGNDLWISSDGGLNYSTDWAATSQARMNGISGSDMWGFGAGWNEDILVGGRYHNGNMAWHESFPEGKFYRMGGAEAATGYVNPGPGRKVYHSDIGGHALRPGFGNGAAGFSVGEWPTESYAYYANSEMEWHPQCWNIVFIGKDNKIWKSTDGGATYTVLYTFPGTADNDVFEIEVSRSNPQIMYCSQWDGTDDRMWRSADGGATWTGLTALPLPNNNDRVKMALSAENANVLWVAVTYGSNGKKIYKSTDGGQSWVNLTTATLNNIRITNIMAQYGTDGGIYLGTNAGVFYRNNTLGDWQPFSDGLPLSAETNRLKPFYKDGKIRNGCWGFGVWESPLYEPSSVVVQAMTDKLESSCARDTFYFDDYSVTRHDGASWSWSFTGNPQTVIGADTRTPKVVFAGSGAKKAVMTLQVNGTTYRDTLDLTVGNACDRDSLAGKALQLDGSGDRAVANAALNLNSNRVTITAWIKRLGTQDGRAGIVFCRGGTTTAGVGFDGDRLSYHWNDGGWAWNSGHVVPQNEWTHVAFVVDSSKVYMYMNGKQAVNNAVQQPEAFDAPIVIGEDPNGTGRFFNGLIDEVCIYRRALSISEIREQMNLTRTHTPIDGLVAYYQFNETSGTIQDRIGTRHAGLSGNAARTASTAPVGPGYSKRLTISAAGTFNFGPKVALSLITPASGPYPGGDVWATRLNTMPDVNPTTEPVSRAYWIVRNYGTNATFNQLTKIRFSKLGNVPSNISPNQYKLYFRPANADGAVWNLLDNGDNRTSGADGLVWFTSGNNVTQMGQFIVTKPVAAPDAETAVVEERQLPVARPELEVRIAPNPVAAGQSFEIVLTDPNPAVFRLYDEKGRAVRVENISGSARIQTQGLAAGVYMYRVENDAYMKSGILVID